MRKICLFISMSLDGYIVDSEGGVSLRMGIQRFYNLCFYTS